VAVAGPKPLPIEPLCSGFVSVQPQLAQAHRLNLIEKSGHQPFSCVHFCTQSQGRKPDGRVMSLAGWFEGSCVVDDEPTILVIEDDEPIQTVVEDALIEGGFEPAIASSGEEAVTLLKGRLINYRALVTDINLKGRIDGWEVARQARELDPEFPIVYITGAGADKWPSRGVPNSILLEKPFAPAQLITAVSQLLNVGGTPPA
jgi:CheY-like chemotaxis protein